MLDPRSLEDRRDDVLESCRKRGIRADVDSAITAYRAVASRQTELNQLNQQRNEHQKTGKRKLSSEEREAHGAEGRAIKEAVAACEQTVRDAQEALDDAMQPLPNFVHAETPEGGEECFRVLREPDALPSFDFTPKDHLAIGEQLDLIDFERAAKVSGQKFYYLKNEAALLDLALQRFALDHAMAAGFTPVVTPDLARPEIVQGLGFNPRGEETQIYSIENENLCLVGTAEITLGGMYANHIFDEDDLPLKLAGVSHCFRTEAGAHGRESRGLYRVHQFSKTEMFVFTRPEDSEATHLELRQLEERVFDALELPYRVIEIAAGDLGAPAYRKFDLEVWMPGRGDGGDWGEVTSTSNCTDYQARRLKVRFRRKNEKKVELVHMLNGTVVSNARAILALLEVHQRADGSIGVPKALVPYLGRTVIGPGGSPVGSD
jgi:seryl-tRNA synthetase